MRLTDPKDIKKRSNSFGSVHCEVYFSIYTEFEEIAIKHGFEFLERAEVNSRLSSLFLWSYSANRLGDDETIVWELYLKFGDTEAFGLEIDWEKSTY
jgi:hypothetical protein